MAKHSLFLSLATSAAQWKPELRAEDVGNILAPVVYLLMSMNMDEHGGRFCGDDARRLQAMIDACSVCALL